MLVPLLGSLPSIDLFGVSSGYNGYGQVSCYITSRTPEQLQNSSIFQTGPSSGYGAPEASYAAPSSSYGPARNSWSQGGEYRSVSWDFLSPPLTSYRHLPPVSDWGGRESAGHLQQQWRLDREQRGRVQQCGQEHRRRRQCQPPQHPHQQCNEARQLESNYKLKMLFDQTPDTRHTPMDWIKSTKTNLTDLQYFCVLILLQGQQWDWISNRISLIITMRQPLNYDGDFYFYQADIQILQNQTNHVQACNETVIK